jgi:hypothetical protein
MEESIFTAAEAVRQILQALTRIQELLYSSETDDTLPEVDVQLSSIRVASHMLANGGGYVREKAGQIKSIARDLWSIDRGESERIRLQSSVLAECSKISSFLGSHLRLDDGGE